MIRDERNSTCDCQEKEEAAVLRQDERIDDLQRNGLRIIQSDSHFKFGTDAVLLADFATQRPRDRVADLGAGTGILPILMSDNMPHAVFDAWEIQPDMAELARRSVALNKLEGRITIHTGDLRNAYTEVGVNTRELVVCNPPYGRVGSTILSHTDAQFIARHETDCTLPEIVLAGARLLKHGGRLAMVYPAPQSFTLMFEMRAHQIEPKRLRMVHFRADRPAKLALVEGVRGGRPGLSVLAPLILQEYNGDYTPEYRRIYRLDR